LASKFFRGAGSSASAAQKHPCAIKVCIMAHCIIEAHAAGTAAEKLQIINIPNIDIELSTKQGLFH
jgi:hypothetical protein